MKSFATSLIDFFIPRICISCEGKLTSEEDSICAECYSKIKYAGQTFLLSEYRKKFKEDNVIKDFHSIFIFEENSPIRDILHALKYEKKFRLGYFLGRIIAANLDEKIKSWEIDLMIPVPLHKLKKAERGFNQSYYIAKSLSNFINVKLSPNILKRGKFTPSQTKLNIDERKENIKCAFSVRKQYAVKNKNIILLDDVITTGATVSECARILKESGARNVYAVSIAIADYN